MPEISVEVEVYCSCGNGLCNQATGGGNNHRGDPSITVEPCEKCLDNAYEQGRSEGHTEGLADSEVTE